MTILTSSCDTSADGERHKYAVSLSETQKRLLSVLLQAKNSDRIGLTRGMLVEILHIARTTLYDNLKILRKLRIVDKKKIHKEGRGRPPILWFVKDGKS